MTIPGEIFRALHQQPGAFIIPNPWDIGSARILAGLGFKALATTSAGMAFSLGLPDGTVPREAVLAHCRSLVAATPLPVSADLEKGFGNAPDEVAETITAAAAVGLSGCSIEDHTGRRDAPIFEASLAEERIAAAAEACRGLPEDFVLTARCESLLWGESNLDEVIGRLQAYERAGADVLFAPGLRDLGAIGEVCSALGKPVNVVIEAPNAAFGVAELADAGVKRISVGVALAQAAYGALITAAREIAENGRFQFGDNAIGYAELEAFSSGSAIPWIQARKGFRLSPCLGLEGSDDRRHWGKNGDRS
jgi:2-methylisocitrate lyase-like PEP mutase family enzyme